uniref:Uncharacterized protein n=1 Tax=Utricularia reniformis TaxID=192314 RepID=A0A1Y0B1E6_9LAMI|nr:hypothetical protein AEK19_MT1053 [Utricularia reniformis]ART31276.1 hypothetical protein AEK19_MT1053 [Utricularia reniformis]
MILHQQSTFMILPLSYYSFNKHSTGKAERELPKDSESDRRKLKCERKSSTNLLQSFSRS